MTNIVAPSTHSQSESILGQAYRMLEPRIRQELAEQFDPLASVLFAGPPVDFAKSATDTARIDRFGNLGAAKKMTSMSGETDPGTLSYWTAAYDELVIGRKHLAYSESFQYRGLNARGPTLEEMPAHIAGSYLATVREDVCVVGAAFSNNVADAADEYDVDDLLALINAATSTDGFQGVLDLMHKSRQIGYLRGSLRAETALQFPVEFNALMAPVKQGGFQFQVMGVRHWASNDVVSSAGDDFGFAWTPNAFVRGIMSTGDLGDISDANPLYLTEYGMVITRKTDGSTTIKRIDANAWSAVGVLDNSIAPHWLVRNDDGV